MSRKEIAKRYAAWLDDCWARAVDRLYAEGATFPQPETDFLRNQADAAWIRAHAMPSEN